MKQLFVVIVLIGLSLPLNLLAQRVGGGDIVFRPSVPGVKPVLFSHEKHVSEKGIKCCRCHYEIFEMARGSYGMNMEKITKGEFCGMCHNGRDAFDVHDKTLCEKCHH
ncbi:MAG: c(7)-type cytochrome triheme domain-containing protein [Nitrospirota bacterium]|jgi:c(7)-type cytochrome triheme protein